jgi:hypothetical protein
MPFIHAIFSATRFRLKLRFFRFLCAWLVHLLYDLKRKYHIADLVGLTIPNKLDFSLISKQQKSVFVRQWPAQLQKSCYVSNFVVSESHRGRMIPLG